MKFQCWCELASVNHKSNEKLLDELQERNKEEMHHILDERLGYTSQSLWEGPTTSKSTKSIKQPWNLSIEYPSTPISNMGYVFKSFLTSSIKEYEGNFDPNITMHQITKKDQVLQDREYKEEQNMTTKGRNTCMMEHCV